MLRLLHFQNYAILLILFEEKLAVGFEPTTYALRMRCSTDWAMLALNAANFNI